MATELKNAPDNKIKIGWKEWCSLPLLGIPVIKAKVDTGAKTSSLHAYAITPFYHHRKLWVRFYLHPLHGDNKFNIHCSAPVVDQRFVTSSTGHKELRYVIKTTLELGGRSWEIELTLANREKMSFRMLLGRDALTHQTVIDPSHVHMQLKLTTKKARLLFTKGKT